MKQTSQVKLHTISPARSWSDLQGSIPYKNPDEKNKGSDYQASGLAVRLMIKRFE